MTFSVSSDEFNSFYSIDRDLYTRLVLKLRRDPAQSMWVMGLLLWLEEVGYPSIVLTLRSLPDNVVLDVFVEAVAILNCIQFETRPSSSTCKAIPRISSLVDQEITLQFLHENRAHAMNGISKTVTEVCARALEDIMQQATKMGPIQYHNGGNLGVDLFPKQVRPQGVLAARPGQLKMPVIPFIPHALHPAFHPLLRFRSVCGAAASKE